MAKKNGANSGNDGDYEVGYGRPPKSGQIKPGEVRNRWGKSGRPKPTEDLLLKVAAELVPANINGRAASLTQEEGAIRRLFQEALKGNIAAAKLLLEKLERRRPPAPPVPTPEEIAKAEAEQKEREALAARLVGLLEEEASRKKSLVPRLNHTPLIRPSE